MSASPIVRKMYHQTLERFGEPDGSIAFYDPPPPNDSWPQRIDVLYWKDTEDLDITTFSTIGMCDRPMRHAEHRCELHFSIRGRAETINMQKVSAFCANLAVYPFAHETFFDWAQLIKAPGDIPCFPSCRYLMLHPAFVKDGWDQVVIDGTKILIMNLVPLNESEVQYRAKHGPFSIFDYIVERQLDIFSDRPDSD